ncbi:hypothetical protein PRIPAC_79344 [Pristionchus pacificus]|nr:hypothetical protein PRIPAC_79344 [Pristionchus pacificus]
MHSPPPNLLPVGLRPSRPNRPVGSATEENAQSTTYGCERSLAADRLRSEHYVLDTASMTMWLRLVEQYRNPSLGWSLTEYPQPAIPVSAGDVYLPELRSCSGGVLERKLPSEIQVDHTGIVTVRSDAIMTSMCRPSYDTYPYDRNNCFMCFETHRAGTKARLTVIINGTYLKGTPEVIIIGPVIITEETEYEEGGMHCQEVLIKVVLQRNPTVIMLMVFLPALLLYIEIFLVLRFPDVEEFKMLLEGTSVYATLNLAIVEVLARTNTLPGIGKYTSGSQVVLLLLSILFVLIRHWTKQRAEPKSSKTSRHPLESWPTKHHGVLLLEESQTSTSPSSFGYTTGDYREYLRWARGWIEGHPEATALAVVYTRDLSFI